MLSNRNVLLSFSLLCRVRSDNAISAIIAMLINQSAACAKVVVGKRMRVLHMRAECIRLIIYVIPLA